MNNKYPIPAIKLSSQYNMIKDEINDAITLVLENGNFILGENVNKIEKNIANYCQCDYALGVASGTDGLLLCLMALGIGFGDEVITTPFTFYSSASVIYRVGAKPVFVDIDDRTFNIDFNMIEQAINKNTKAIIAVHLFGYPADMLEINRIAKKYNIFVIEDAAQAMGAKIENKSIGSLSDIAAFSFYPTKILGAFGDGGIITTDNKTLYERIDLLRRQGAKQKYYHEVIGINSRLDEIQAAILAVKFKYIEKWIEQRRDIAFRYNEFLVNKNIRFPNENDNYYHVYHQYTIQVTSNRDNLYKYLLDNGIEATIYYPFPLHLQPAFIDLGYKEGSFPKSEAACKDVLSLPCYPELTLFEQKYIASKINDFFNDNY